MDRKTVRSVVRPKARKQRPRPSLLDPFRPLIRKLVLEDELTAERVLQDIRAVGYTGSYTILKEYIRTFRPKKSSKRAHERFETDPGVQGQVDLSPYTVILGEVPTKVVCFSMVFGFSRWQYIRFLLHADARSVCHCHVLAFEAAGGVPHEILYDRMKQIVIESYKDGVVFHPLFELLVEKYGFTAIPLAPGYKEGKGKVEEPFRPIEDDFLKGRRFHDLEDLNRQAVGWFHRREQRIHRTTHEQPKMRLDQERPLLISLPFERFDAAQVEPRSVGDDYCIPWETNRYSVPPSYVGKTTWARVLEGELEVIFDNEVIARHRLRDTRHKRYVLPEHEVEFRQHSTSRHVLAEQFARLGSCAGEFVDGLREAKGAAAGYHMSRILQLADKVGVLRVSEALRHASRYGAFDAHAVERILTGRHPARSKAEPRQATSTVLPSAVAEFLKGAGSFQRSVQAYERLARHAAADPPAGAQPNEEDNHGQRGDGSADRSPEAPEAQPRRPEHR